MPDVRFKDLCIDATAVGDTPRRVAEFWGRLLGQEVVERDDGPYVLEPPPGGPDGRRVWVNDVPEPMVGKSRVHLDVRLPPGSVDDLVAAGATVRRAPDGEVRWHVLEDPDGLVFCVMGPHPRYPDAPFGPFELVVDAADPVASAQWWAARTGATVNRPPDAPWCFLTGVAGFPFDFWVFTPVPEPKRAKNRVHWDVTLADGTIGDLVRAGARLLREPDGTDEWWVLADPEGNEFCAFAPPG
ncbi:MAG: hypothetical protein KatS3mg009_1596 [Acidimicrobiia bacterium]|nr:MAG: hypothetical protein KatS3mg009_1596 [Acidimicrobiia bacterium]